jgi:hypothetical protein
MKINSFSDAPGAFVMELNRKPVLGHGTNVVIAEPQDIDEMWRQLNRGARGQACLDLYTPGKKGTDINLYLAKRMLSEHLRASVQTLPDGTVRIPCKDAAEAQLRKGKIEQFVRTSEEGYPMPVCNMHLLDESQWVAADLCRENGSGFSETGLPMAALHVPDGDALVCIPETREGRVIGLRMVLRSVLLDTAESESCQPLPLPSADAQV